MTANCIDAPAATAATTPRTAALLRQAVLDAKGAVHGYELLDRSPSGDAVNEALLQREPLQLADRRLLFVRATPQLLDGPALKQADPANLVLQMVPPAGERPEDIAAWVPDLQQLRERGFRLALGRSAIRKAYAACWPLATYVKLDLESTETELLEPLLKFVHTHTTAQTIACQIASKAQFERLVALGVPLFQGDWFARPSPVPGGTIKPSQAVVIQLINLLHKEADLDEIEPLLKRDPSLSFNLLRAINASGMGLSCEITSLRHAVMILGQKRLFRWATMLLTMARGSGGAPAVATTAMVRGRLMELLAAELLAPQDCDNAFVTGVFSLLDAMLDMPMARALESLALPQPVADALLRREGMLAPFLALTEACESGDDAAFAEAADQLQLSSHQVNWAHLQALAWAEELAQGW